MTKKKVNLDDVSIAAPCPVTWAEMEGDERKRFCSLCSLHVYNISEMKRKEAEDFLSANTEGVCLRLFRRADGTLIAKDCPVGRRLADAVKRRVRAVAVALVAMLNASAVFGQDTKLKVPDSPIRTVRPRMGFVFQPNTWPKKSEPGNDGEQEVKSEVMEGGAPVVTESARLGENRDLNQKADTTAMDAFRAAQVHQGAKCFREAAESYEIAIKAFRANKDKYDHKFEVTVVKEYAKLLRQQKHSAKAKLIEKEFCRSF
ncbi:MAG: hypothetical protein WC028_27420 [Candidatus Obscuribacterales bacterium]